MAPPGKMPETMPDRMSIYTPQRMSSATRLFMADTNVTTKRIYLSQTE